MKKLLLSSAILALTSVAGHAREAHEMFRTQVDPLEIHASDFIGKRVYRAEVETGGDAFDGVQNNWDDIGEINDVILSRDGSAEAVLVDIGGFLGMGERQIAVDMDAIRFVADSSTADDRSDYFLVLNAPVDTLKGAPEYSWSQATSAGTASDMATGSVAATADADRMPLARDGYVEAAPQDLTAEALTGAAAYDANDEWIGEVSTLVLTPDGKAKALVVDVGGFLGIGEKPVELDLSKIDILRPADDSDDIRVYISLTKDEMESLPDHKG